MAGTLALLMPLSIPFLVYAFISGVSMRQLSMAGLVPGPGAAVALIGVCVWYGRQERLRQRRRARSRGEIWAATKDAGPALLMPLIIVGGIWSGVFTPTESAAVAVVYGVARLAVALSSDITVRDLPRLLVNAFQTSATVMLVIGATGALAWLITVEQVAVQLAAWIKVVASEPWMFLLLVNVALLLLGIFIEPLPAMLLTAPLLLPLAQDVRHRPRPPRRDDHRQPRDRAVHAAGGRHAVRRGQARRARGSARSPGRCSRCSSPRSSCCSSSPTCRR